MTRKWAHEVGSVWRWFQRCQFGWARVFDATALQATANEGGIGIACRDREEAGRPGHVAIVVLGEGILAKTVHIGIFASWANISVIDISRIMCIMSNT